MKRKPFNLLLNDDEREQFQVAADFDRRPLADWIRLACDAAVGLNEKAKSALLQTLRAGDPPQLATSAAKRKPMMPEDLQKGAVIMIRRFTTKMSPLYDEAFAAECRRLVPHWFDWSKKTKRKENENG